MRSRLNLGDRAADLRVCHRKAGSKAAPCYGRGMVKRIIRIALVAATLAPALLAGGCADRDKFPSLARRSAEDAYRAAQLPAPVPAPSQEMTAGLTARLAALRASAREAHAGFESKRGAATRAVGAAAGAAMGTEAWSVASVALAELESARARAGLPLAELDRLEADASNRAAGGAPADLEAVHAARVEVESLVDTETKVIDGLLSQLRG
ncbi:hypothetical protein Saro_0928 [Novosphingobium aromaticivorans DSM 12444]|uniref:Uncharacterized protein n=2 Tax=Novosphingobium aromaticivorans TaxID=48935 RepID=Q2G9V0_NOVAD|nr:hypothetical protein Saro_0928 [Novosphingobium aromaticivorans DSM 12444]